MPRFLPRLPLLLALGLAACSGNGENAAGLSCRSLAPLLDGPNASNVCAAGEGCRVDKAGNAADGDFGSAATLRQGGITNGFVAVSARASGGGMFAAGTVVGVIWEASAAAQNGLSFQLNTYLAGAIQDSKTLYSAGAGSPERPITQDSLTTTRPYDSVEFRYVRTQGSETGTARVYEFCAD